MRRIFLSLTAAGAIGSAAFASDLPDRQAPPPALPAAAPAVSWAGFYGGLNAGYGWGEAPVSLSGDPGGLFEGGVTAGVLPTSIAARPQGLVGGAQVGWNSHAGGIVWGVEGDFDYAGVRDGGTVVTPFGLYPASIGVPRTLRGAQSLDWLSTARLRLGFTPTDRLLIFATGGGAAGGGGVSVSLTTNDIGGVPGSGCAAGTCENQSVSKTLLGWSAGFGAEYAIGGAWSLGAEYLHYDLGRASATAWDPTWGPRTNITTGAERVSGDIARATLNYRFGGL